jgi:hypothetical protein
MFAIAILVGLAVNVLEPLLSQPKLRIQYFPFPGVEGCVA